MNVFFLLFMMFQATLLMAEPTSIGPINFGGGLNLQTVVTDIGDNESPDMCNCITNFDGSVSKRFGSEPYVRQPVSSQPVSNIYRAYASTGQEYRSAIRQTAPRSDWRLECREQRITRLTECGCGINRPKKLSRQPKVKRRSSTSHGTKR